MRKATTLVASVLVLVICANANAVDTILDGFQGTFGDVEIGVAGTLDCVGGATSGQTALDGLLADISKQEIDSTGWANEGDSVSIVSHLFLTSTSTSGVAEYSWDDTVLYNLDFHELGFAAGAVTGKLTRVSDTIVGYDLPPELYATLSYNGAYIDGNSDANLLPFSSASISAQAIPEPTSMMMLGLASLGLLLYRRRRLAS